MSDQNDTFNRREFLKWVSILGLSGFLSACRINGYQQVTAEASKLHSTATEIEKTSTPSSSSNQGSTGSLSNDPTSTDIPPQVTSSPPPTEVKPENAYLAVAHGESIEDLVFTAIAALGGIERFIKNGSDVIIKPNICTNYYSYEYAATTNPSVIAALVRLCQGAGAGRVRVMDQPFAGSPDSAYTRSGIAEAVAAAGGEMEIMNWNKYANADIPDGIDIKQWSFYKPILDADVVIDVPIAKHHGLTGLTLAGKNLLGTINKPSGIHKNHAQRIADLVSRVKPTLTVIDAVRILMRNGPTGGNLDDVKLMNTVIASHDLIAADAYAATLFGLTGADIGYIAAGAKMGLGIMDLKAIKIEEMNY